jgi:hypothetical protein
MLSAFTISSSFLIVYHKKRGDNGIILFGDAVLLVVITGTGIERILLGNFLSQIDICLPRPIAVLAPEELASIESSEDDFAVYAPASFA